MNKDVTVLYKTSLIPLGLEGVNTTNGRRIWKATIYIPGLITLARFTRINDELLIMTYSLYGGIYGGQEEPFVANLTVINALTGRIINHTVLVAVSSAKYYMAANAIGNNVYVVIIPLISKSLKPVNTTIIDLRLLGKEPYGVEVWRTEVINSCISFSIVVTGIKRFSNYVLITLSCSDKPLTYVLNASNGKLMLRANVSSNVYGIAGNTLIYQCGGRICGLNLINNRTWALPIIGDVASVTISEDEALVLTTTGYTIWAYGITGNGTLLFRRELWTYTAPLTLCSIGLRYTFTAESYPIGDYALVIILPEGTWYISGGGFGCMPQSIIILNPNNGHVVVSVTKSAWIAYLNAYPYSFNNLWQALDINYVSNDYVIYSVNNALNSRTFTHQYTYYLTTPKAITNEWWYYTINDTPYPALTTTALLIALAILYRKLHQKGNY
ncbi:hypothetical protein [Vulcanisaeta sp. JCM 14467]|uniref:hypothetical protein n=1 Tax=Vulcanisaeta sp. JCM 14467 TaxID=1295370 RepID=UPI000AC81A47|nr:hypothetical protein [Vulcanisaeta sp. JCM 14467]